MKPGIPWSFKGIEPEVREAAKHAARKAGMTLGEWLNTVILDQSDEESTGNQAEPMTRHEEIIEADAGHPPPRREETTIRLEDIANQLAQLWLVSKIAQLVHTFAANHKFGIAVLLTVVRNVVIGFGQVCGGLTGRDLTQVMKLSKLDNPR